ncbi:MAG: acyltransferase [Candidatus Sedimenticola sp. (ex Thyasira tokunagai)]
MASVSSGKRRGSENAAETESGENMMSYAPFQSATIPQDRLLPGIHGLRGMATFAVVLFHLVHIGGIATPHSFAFIGADFGKGVHLFFVLSAFSLMHSTEHTMYRTTWATEYFVKRFFRIAPLYYFIMAGMLLWSVIKSQTWTVDFQTLILNLTFTFGFAPWTGIVWAGWTVGIEMIFYAILPVLLLTVRTRFATLILVVISILVTYAARLSLHGHFEITVTHYGYNWSYFSFATNLCFFAFGMYAYRLAQHFDRTSVVVRWAVPAFATALLGTLLLGRLYNVYQGDLMLWGVGFAALSLWQCKWPSRWSANKMLEYVGERSYSVYLLHPVVIVLFKNPIQALYGTLTPAMGAYAYFVCAVPLLLTLLLLSEMTYRLIEVPAIRRGQKINASLRKAESMSHDGAGAGAIRQDT